jgi:hypothetical protein
MDIRQPAGGHRLSPGDIIAASPTRRGGFMKLSETEPEPDAAVEGAEGAGDPTVPQPVTPEEASND